MYRFWTADPHFGHGNICIYAKRPVLRDGDLTPDEKWVTPEIMHERAAEMNAMLLRNMNSRIHEEDTAINVGDFCCRGNERGISGTKTKFHEWLAQLNGTWILIEGNHDYNNKVKTVATGMLCSLGPYTVWVQHDPFKHRKIMTGVDAVICGHVHNRWKEALIDGVLFVNVGVDVRNYLPLTDSELIGVIARCKSGALSPQKITTTGKSVT